MTLKTDITKNMVSKEWLSNHFCIYLYLFKYELAFKVWGIRFKIYMYIYIYIWDRGLVQVWSMDLCVGDLKENIIHLFIWLFSFLWCVCRCACLCVHSRKCDHKVTKTQVNRLTGKCHRSLRHRWLKEETNSGVSRNEGDMSRTERKLNEKG